MRAPIILPPALQPFAAENRWVVWKLVKNRKGKLTKPPYRANAPHQHAKCDDPSTWCDLPTAMQAYRQDLCDGIGFALMGSDYGAFDLDDCRDAKTGDLIPWAQDKIERSKSYAEVTPSGEGVRIIGIAMGDHMHRKFDVPNANGASVELYRKAERFITVTGQELGGAATTLANIDALLDATEAELDDEKKKKLKPKHDLGKLIKDGCGQDFGGDRSRAVWYVINRLLKQGRAADDIVAVLLDRGNGISSHIYDQPHPDEYARKQVENAQKELRKGVSLDDFFAYMLQHNYVFAPTGELWPGSSVNGRIEPIFVGLDENGEPKFIAASTWLDQNKPVEQMTWAPAEPQLIRDKLITKGGWIPRAGARLFNQYRPPTLAHGDASKAGPWLDHVRRVYPTDADHIIKCLAHRVQRPQEKLNHALVLGGDQGIGKDSLLEPVRLAVGPWNWQEESPHTILENQFTDYLEGVVLRISEARDLGEFDRYSFYERTKTFITTPPPTIRVNAKHIRQYYILNLCFVVITTNHKTDGIFLPAGDRRYYVAWSELKIGDFEPDYWTKLWRWYEDGGYGHVAAYLAAYDLTGFDPKAPPRKTEAFWDIVDANRAAEDAELADVLDAMGDGRQDANGDPAPPIGFTLAKVQEKAGALAKKDDHGNPERNSFAAWLADRKNRRQIPHRFETVGYSPVRNEAADDGLWKVGGKRQTIYALASLSLHQRLDAAKQVIDRRGEPAFDLELFGAGR
jgi:hypothetical protein